MKRILIALSIAATFVLAGTGLGSAQEDHVAQALKHASAAVENGEKGYAAVLTEQAEQALQHAQAAEKETSHPHLQQAIQSLQEAIKHGKMGHAEVAAKQAQEAVDHLNASKK